MDNRVTLLNGVSICMIENMGVREHPLLHYFKTIFVVMLKLFDPRQRCGALTVLISFLLIFL